MSEPQATAIRQASDRLLKRAKAEAGEARQRAVLRLTDLCHGKCLTDAQRQELGELLWAERSANGLPNLQNFAVFGFLYLPAPPGVDVASLIKQALMATKPPCLLERSADGKVSIHGRWSTHPLIREVALASKPVVQLAGESRGGIEWTTGEACELLRIASVWWQNDKQVFQHVSNDGPMGDLAAEPVRNTLGYLDDFLARAVFPNLAPDDATWNQVLAWLEEARSFGAYPTAAWPYVLLKRPGEQARVELLLQQDLNSDVPDCVAKAAKSLCHWLHLAHAGKVTSPVASLLDSLIERVVFRRKCAADSCLHKLASLIGQLPSAVGPQQASLLASSLPAWHEATTIGSEVSDGGDFAREARPILRAVVAEVAGALAAWRQKMAPATPDFPGVTLWRELCATDPLPEVGRTFDAMTRANERE